MQLPSNLAQLIEDTPHGRVTVDIHRAFGETPEVKVRTAKRVKTVTVEEAGRAVGDAMQQILLSQSSGHLDVQISFKQGTLQFTVLEAFLQ